jgi:hypothetical protein
MANSNRQPLLSERQSNLVSDEATHLLDRYKPYLRIDRKEPFPPMAIEQYIANSALYAGDKEVMKPGQLNMATLAKIRENPKAFFQENKLEESTLRIQPTLHPDEKGSEAFYAPANWRNTAKIYGKAFDEKIREKDGTELEVFTLHYALTYGFDDPTSCLPFFKKNKTPGWHPGDIERVTVYVLSNDHPTDASKKRGDILKVYFAQHGSGEGECVSGDKIERDNDHVVINVARGTHASYPRPGRWLRIMGCFNDIIDPAKQDKPWQPEVVADEQLFEMDNVKYGDVTAKKGFWNPQIGERYLSTNTCARCCCATCACCPDTQFEWIKDQCMRFDHVVIESQHRPAQASSPVRQSMDMK